MPLNRTTITNKVARNVNPNFFTRDKGKLKRDKIVLIEDYLIKINKYNLPNKYFDFKKSLLIYKVFIGFTAFKISVTSAFTLKNSPRLASDCSKGKVWKTDDFYNALRRVYSVCGWWTCKEVIQKYAKNQGEEEEYKKSFRTAQIILLPTGFAPR